MLCGDPLCEADQLSGSRLQTTGSDKMNTCGKPVVNP